LGFSITHERPFEHPTWSFPLSHSEFDVQYHMSKLENWQPGERRRDTRPEWMTNLIENVAEVFEPLTGVARVGFDCRLQEGEPEEGSCGEPLWVVRMYLGRNELVGGPHDGRQVPMSFDLDLDQLQTHFNNVDEFCWSVFPADGEDIDQNQSFVTVSGLVGSNRVRMHVFAVAPHEIAPAMRTYQTDGRCELT
jgi:hypothetical protein